VPASIATTTTCHLHEWLLLLHSLCMPLQRFVPKFSPPSIRPDPQDRVQKGPPAAG
jgi:hypothetical protein